MLKLKLVFLIVVFISFNNHYLFSKDLPKNTDVPVQFSNIEKKKLEQANALIKEGMDLWSELNHRFNPESVLSHKIDSIYNVDAYPILAKAAENFLEGTTAKYEIYHKNCLEFWAKHNKTDYPTGVDNAKKMQKEALNYLEKAKLNRRVAENYDHQYVYAYDRYYEAISLEIIAAKKEGRALQVYRDWPVHYAYEWDEDVEVDLFSPKTKPVAVKGPKIVLPEIKKEVELPDSMIIYYMVQIAAHTIQISPKYIKENVYEGQMPVSELKEEGWYKYTIGHYKTLDEAERLLNQINVAKAFVVAYKNGKRVPIKEAIDNQPKNK